MLLNLDKILVPIDFSDTSLAALKYAGSIAQKSGASIFVLHVIQGYASNTGLEITEDINKELVQTVRLKVNEITSGLPILQGLSIVPMVCHGKIHEVIQRAADEKDAKLIVMGTRGEIPTITKDFKKYVLGTNAFRTVEISNVPVITLRKELKREEIKTIVLPLDLADDSTTQKVLLARDLAEAFHAEIHVLAVTEDMEHDITITNKLNDTLNNVSSVFMRDGFKVVTVVFRSNDIPHDLMDYANKVKADMMVIMVRKGHRMEEFFLRSDQRIIITQSKTPVLSVKTKRS